MAGYVKLQRTIWTDPDFVALSPEAQRMYVLLISQPDISHVGIVPYMPTRWARLSVGSTLDSTLAATVELIDRNYVAVDDETCELWVRSYIVHDEAFKLTNGKKALVNAHDRVYSRRLRAHIATVLLTVDSTLEVTVDPTVDLSHKTVEVKQEPAPAPEAPPLAAPVDPGVRKATLFAAAGLIFQRQPPTRLVGNAVGYRLGISDRLTEAYPDVDDLIATMGSEDAALHIANCEAALSAQGSRSVTDDAPAEPNLTAARRFGASIKHQHLEGDDADLVDINRDTFIRYDLTARNEHPDWNAAAIEAYDDYQLPPKLRAVE